MAAVKRRDSSLWGFPGGSDGKESVCNAGDLGSIPGSGRSPGKRNGYTLQYSFLKIPWIEEPDRLQSTWGCKELDMTKRLTLRVEGGEGLI